MRIRLPPRLKRLIIELIVEEGKRGRDTITKRREHTTYVSDASVDTPSLKIGGTEVIDSSRNIKNVVDAYIGGKINNIPIGLNVGGVIGFWYDLRAESRNLAKGRLVEITIHSVIDFTNYNPQGIGNYFGCRIVGFISPRYSETYTFYITSDDGVRVWFNGKLVIDAWKDQPATTYSWTANLEADRWYPIVIEHYEHGGTERLCLEWESASQDREVVPSDRLAYSTIDLITALRAIHGDLSIVGGKLLFGGYSSGSKFDVCLYRSDVNVLKTDDDFDARSLRIGGTEVIDSSRNLKNVTPHYPYACLYAEAFKQGYIGYVPLDSELKTEWEGGWLKVWFNNPNTYKKLYYQPNIMPWGPNVPDTVEYFMTVVHFFKDIFDFYPLFFERRPGDATTHLHGFYLHSDGTLEARSYPGTLSGTTSGTIAAGDIVIFILTVANVDGELYARYRAIKYDWDADEVTDIINCYADVGAASNQEPNRYICVGEQRKATGRIAYTSTWIYTQRLTAAPTGGCGYDLALKRFKALREYGLQDPRTLTF